MAKLKTKKTVASRFKKTKNNKLVKKTCGHGHFNGRENGKTGRAKRLRGPIADVEQKNLIEHFQY